MVPLVVRYSMNVVDKGDLVGWKVARLNKGKKKTVNLFVDSIHLVIFAVSNLIQKLNEIL